MGKEKEEKGATLERWNEKAGESFPGTEERKARMFHGQQKMKTKLEV